jgi:hypothetical protein
MYLQVCLEYKSLPDHDTLHVERIEFFYNGIRPELLKATKPEASQ